MPEDAAHTVEFANTKDGAVSLELWGKEQEGWEYWVFRRASII